MKTAVDILRIPLDVPEGLQAALEALCVHMASLPEPKRLVSATAVDVDMIIVFELANQ